MQMRGIVLVSLVLVFVSAFMSVATETATSPQRGTPETLATTDIELLHAHYINRGMLHIKDGAADGCRGILVGQAGSAFGSDAVVLNKLGDLLVNKDDGSGTMQVVGGGQTFLAAALDAGLVVSIVKGTAPENGEQQQPKRSRK